MHYNNDDSNNDEDDVDDDDDSSINNNTNNLLCVFFQGTKIIGVHCDTNDAKTCKLTSEIQSNRRVYKCECDGSLHTGEVTMYCYLHYWECPFDM